eukprot:scaffold1188_cov255-Pinguiococcus_pyrenoidosus.AAC.4
MVAASSAAAAFRSEWTRAVSKSCSSTSLSTCGRSASYWRRWSRGSDTCTFPFSFFTIGQRTIQSTDPYSLKRSMASHMPCSARPDLRPRSFRGPSSNQSGTEIFKRWRHQGVGRGALRYETRFE